MRYAEWNKLDDDQRKNTHWKNHPHIRMATIFSILFALVFVVVLLRVFQNRRVHVNRKPTDKEAFAIAKAFVKEKVDQPETANFPKNNFHSDIDTAASAYNISSYVDVQDSTGKFTKKQWKVNLTYTSGDWADKNSWRVVKINIGGDN